MARKRPEFKDPWAPLLVKHGGDLDAALADIKATREAEREKFLASIPESSKNVGDVGSRFD